MQHEDHHALVDSRHPVDASSSACFYGDCWGFGKRVATDQAGAFAALAAVHESLTTLVETTSRWKPQVFLLSDSLFVSIPLVHDPIDNELRLDALIGIVEPLCTEAFSRDLPIRGSFGIGRLEAKAQCVVGESVLDAVRLGDRIVWPLAVLARHTLQKAVDTELLRPEVLRSDAAGSVSPRFARFIDIRTSSNGCILGQPLLYTPTSIAAARSWVERALLVNDESAMPHDVVARTLRETRSTIDSWSRTYDQR